MEKLVDIEKRVLQELMFNGFQSSRLAVCKKLRISPSTFGYIIKKLENKKVILGYRVRVNPVALGYSLPLWIFIEPKRSSEIFKLKDELFEIPQFYSVDVITGVSDIASLAFVRSTGEIGSLLEDIIQRFGSRIKRMYTLPVIGLTKLHQVKIRTSGPVKLDSKDYRILEYLFTNPLAGISAISSNTGLHRNTVAKRLKRMWEEQVLLKKSVIVDRRYLSQLGINYWVVMFLELPTQNRSRMLDTLSRLDGVHEVYSLGSTYDALIKVRCSAVSDLAGLTYKLLGTRLATKTVTHLIVDHREKDISVFIGY